MSIFSSTGVKRVIAAGLSALAGIAALVPGGAIVTSILAPVAGVVGATGLVHATEAGTLESTKPTVRVPLTKSTLLSTISAVVIAVTAVAQFIPAAAPYMELLQHIATLLGVATVAKASN